MPTDDPAVASNSAGDDRSRGLVERLVPGPLRRRYLTKFVVAFAVVVVLIAGIGAMGYAETQAEVTERTEQRLTTTARLHADSMTEWVTSMQSQTVLLSSTQEVVAMVDEARAISERTAEESEHAAVAAEEQTSALTEVAGSVTNLAERVDRLTETLDQFETGPQSAGPTPPTDPVSTD